MTRFAEDHPERVGRLVYLDAAYDRAEVRRMLLLSLVTNPRPPLPPRARGRDTQTIAAYNAYLARVHGARWPEAEIRATRRVAADGSVGKDTAERRAALHAMKGAQAIDYRRLRAPALAVYATQDSVAKAYPWLQERGVARTALDGALWLNVSGAAAPAPLNAWNWLHGRWRPYQKDQEKRFATEAANGRSVELAGPHYIFLARPDEVARLAADFLREPSAAR
jgi:pimeloyl-ACP methyl ester carboxylesterase